ncbi:CCAAT/enhancer-binding protein zeta [Scaptodrosophila lebanonensis]|uniref:CCAAT/enhancer-binding protein zeta n=1 Tax=Drosophila lebanonensis TaxID=7225 RepID=A0A6J2U0S7_DROLE|nr:CCAAT/enhancer-binding protein zeta [Scaptodrosophila lebanonensis]
MSTPLNNKKIVFSDDGTPLENKAMTEKLSKSRNPVLVNVGTSTKHKLLVDSNGEAKKPKRIKFDNDEAEKNIDDTSVSEDSDENNDDPDRRFQYQSGAEEVHKKWYHLYPQFTCYDEVLDLKENEQLDIFNTCKSAFEAEKPTYNKRNPSDARWLQTALHKGTAKDRANAGALLVTSNPLGNIEALNILIEFCKLSNKSCNDVIGILTDLWQEVLLPPDRKLLSLNSRGADWKQLRKNCNIKKDHQRCICAYWYFENELKDLYFEFLKILMQGLQTGQEHNKNASIVAAARLLSYAPEKEQMLLTMLINKLGDPTAKIASKALHHLSEVAQRHPNMSTVIVAETEKLIFRNNISERAQHFALCFLSSIAPSGRAEVCTKLVNICFSLFKVLVQRGAVNNRTMQAILRCLKNAIFEAKPANGKTELLNKEMQDTIYRLVHLADIRVSVQTLGLLLQLITVKTEKTDRFYNALYVKLLDLNLINIGSKTAAQLLHIVHRAIHIDKHMPRAQAFIKRLLQLALYLPSHIAAGCMIVLHKVLRMRRELIDDSGQTKETANNAIPTENVVTDSEDKYAENVLPSSPWHHTNIKAVANDKEVRVIGTRQYDPYHRVPAFAGAAYALRNELQLLRQHYHPTVQVFAEQILLQKRIDYYGDPLRDFGLPYFLERFAFKNPKRLNNPHPESSTIAHKRYMAYGTRGKPVKSLTSINCTEDEMYIFNFLEHKRKRAAMSLSNEQEFKAEADYEGDSELKYGEVDDDEFEVYLDSYFGKKFKVANATESSGDDELNYLQELGGEIQHKKLQNENKNKKHAAVCSDDDEDIDDWNDNGDGELDIDGSVFSDNENGSINLDELDDESVDKDSDTTDTPETDDSDDDINVKPSKAKKSLQSQQSGYDKRSFAKKLKTSTNMLSLFAAADDFSNLLEETGKTRGQGTVNAVFNMDKSSDKQINWEEKRRSTGNHASKKISTKSGGRKKIQFGKKRKHSKSS